MDSEYVLVGIHKGAIGSNAERGNLLGTTSDFVRKMCCENQYDVPAVINEINGNLSDQREYFREEILVDLELEDMEKVSLLLDEVIGQDMTEAVNGVFITSVRNVIIEQIIINVIILEVFISFSCF